MIAIGLLASVLAAAPIGPARAGVLCVGPDAGTAGDVQLGLALESLDVPGVRIEPHSALIPLARPAAEPVAEKVDAAWRTEQASLLETATTAYLEGKIGIALERLAAWRALLERVGGEATVAEKVRLALWRLAVYQALKDDAQAEEEALAALTLLPDLQVDLAEFPPSVRETVERVRPRIRWIELDANGLPERARVRIDGRDASLPAKIPAGRHAFAVSAPGRREIVRTVDALADVTVTVSLPLALPDALASALDQAAWLGTSLGESGSALATIHAQTGLDLLLVTSSRDGNTRAVVLPLAEAVPPVASDTVRGPRAASEIAAWARVALAKIAPSVESAKTRRARRALWSAEARAGPSAVSLTRTDRWKGNEPIELPFAGAGSTFAARVRRSGHDAELDAWWASLGWNDVQVLLPDNARRAVTGAQAWSTRLRVGSTWRGTKGEDGPSVRGAIGLGIDRRRWGPVRAYDGGDSGIAASYRRALLELRAEGRLPFRIGPLATALVAAFSVEPWSDWREDHDGASGESPATVVGLAGRIAVETFHRGRLRIVLQADAARSGARFRGSSRMPSDPPFTDASVGERTGAISLVVGWSL